MLSIHRLTNLCGLCVSLITVLAVSVISLGLQGKSPLHSSAPEGVEVPEILDETLGSPMTRYESDSYKYSMVLPSDWHANLDRVTSNGDVFTSPSQDVTIAIGATTHGLDCTNGCQQALADNLSEARLFDPGIALHGVNVLSWKDHPAVMVRTTRTVGGRVESIREYHVIRNECGDVLSIIVTSLADVQQTVEESTLRIIESVEVGK